MSLGRTVIIPALLLAASVAVAAPLSDLPVCVRHAAFAGITQTDTDDNVIGTPDPTDWGCANNQRLSVEPPNPPPELCFWPAYPNPATTAISLRFGLPQMTDVSLVVYGQHGKQGRAFPVRTLVTGAPAPGVYMLNWDLKDDAGARLAPDIYRAVLIVGGKELYGDIEVR